MRANNDTAAGVAAGFSPRSFTQADWKEIGGDLSRTGLSGDGSTRIVRTGCGHTPRRSVGETALKTNALGALSLSNVSQLRESVVNPGTLLCAGWNSSNSCRNNSVRNPKYVSATRTATTRYEGLSALMIPALPRVPAIPAGAGFNFAPSDR